MARLLTLEDRRLEEDRLRTKYWKRWGSYLSERQWGTVREDYSPGGTAWEYLPHDHARSRTYRWEKTASRESATGTSSSALDWRCGMGATIF